MKKLLALVLVLAFATVAFAEDRLSLSGQLRVRGWSVENYKTADSDDKSDKEAYYDQRFRLGGKIKVADDVSVNFRLDLGETAWGGSGQDSVRTGVDMQIDKAYLEVNKEMYKLRAGQQYFGLGNAIAVDHIGTGFLLDIKLPVTLTFGYTKLDENTSLTDEEDNQKDTDVYFANVAFKNDTMGGNFFAALKDDKGAGAGNLQFEDIDYAYNKDSRYVIGLQGDANFGMIALNAELDYFGGKVKEVVDADTAADLGDVDVTGLQLYVDIAGTLSEQLTLGAELFYAKGDKEDLVISELSDFGSFVPMYFGDGDSLEKQGYGVFSVGGTNAGSMGADLYVAYKAMEALTLNAKAGYFVPQEQDMSVATSMMTATLEGNYMFATNTGIRLQYNYTKMEEKDDRMGGNSDAAQGATFKLYTNF